jgi:antiviral helicase SLH1
VSVHVKSYHCLYEANLSRTTLLRLPEKGFALFVAPQRSIINEMLKEMEGISDMLEFSIGFFPAGTLFSATEKRIRLTTPAHLLAALVRHKPMTPIPDLTLVVCDNLEILDPVYELSVSLLRHATQTQPTRFVGFTSSLYDPADLAAWLNVDPSALHSFRPSDREQSLSVSTLTFTIPHSAALFKAMAKPAHAAISAVPNASAIVFVPSRGQCKSIALDLITYCTLETQNANGYLPDHLNSDALPLQYLHDSSMADFIVKGVGFYHGGIVPSDRALMHRLFADGVLRVLLVPRDACWLIPVRAAVVIVMGTQYVHVDNTSGDGGVPHVRDYPLGDLVRMQSRAVRQNGNGHFHLFCQADDKDTYLRFLERGLPLESRLHESEELRKWYTLARKTGIISGDRQGVQALAFTYLARRIVRNPDYYDAEESRDESLSRIVDRLEASLVAEE